MKEYKEYLGKQEILSIVSDSGTNDIFNLRDEVIEIEITQFNPDTNYTSLYIKILFNGVLFQYWCKDYSIKKYKEGN